MPRSKSSSEPGERQDAAHQVADLQPDDFLASGKLSFERVFSDPEQSPYDEIGWEKRSVEITDDTGETVFQQSARFDELIVIFHPLMV